MSCDASDFHKVDRLRSTSDQVWKRGGRHRDMEPDKRTVADASKECCLPSVQPLGDHNGRILRVKQRIELVSGSKNAGAHHRLQKDRDLGPVTIQVHFELPRKSAGKVIGDQLGQSGPQRWLQFGHEPWRHRVGNADPSKLFLRETVIVRVEEAIRPCRPDSSNAISARVAMAAAWDKVCDHVQP